MAKWLSNREMLSEKRSSGIVDRSHFDLEINVAQLPLAQVSCKCKNGSVVLSWLSLFSVPCCSVISTLVSELRKELGVNRDRCGMRRLSNVWAPLNEGYDFQDVIRGQKGGAGA